MVLQFSECMSLKLEPPQLLLNTATTLMEYYPAFLQASIWLQRLMQ